MTATTEFAAKAWYLVQCKARQDERAEAHLQRQGYTCFRSICTRERLLKGERRVMTESLFPGYLFIQLSSQDSWSPLRSTRGVSRIVTFGGDPLPVGDELVDELQRRNHQPLVTPLLAPGENVRINEGPFAELEGVFLGMTGEERAIVLINFLHREHRVGLPLNAVKSLD